MALVSVPPVMMPNPGRLPFNPASVVANAQTLDAANEYYAMLFYAPEAGNIVGVEFRLATVTTGGTLDITIETVDATTGFPDGTPLSNASGSAVIASTDDNAWVSDGFGGGTAFPGNVAVDDVTLYALKITANSGSTPNLQLGGFAASYIPGFPYAVTNTSGSPAKANASNLFCFALEYSGGVYYPVMSGLATLPIHVFGTAYTWDNNDANTEYGARLIPDVPMAFKSVAVSGDFDRGVDTVVTVYDSSNTVLADSVTIDKNQILSYGGGNGDAFVVVPLDDRVTFSAGSAYYIGFKPQGSTATVDLTYWGVNSAALMGAMPGGGTLVGCYRATQGSGSWTIEDTKMPMVFPLVDQLDDGTGGGGGGLAANPIRGFIG